MYEQLTSEAMQDRVLELSLLIPYSNEILSGFNPRENSPYTDGLKSVCLCHRVYNAVDSTQRE